MSRLRYFLYFLRTFYGLDRILSRTKEKVNGDVARSVIRTDQRVSGESTRPPGERRPGEVKGCGVPPPYFLLSLSMSVCGEEGLPLGLWICYN